MRVKIVKDLHDDHLNKSEQKRIYSKKNLSNCSILFALLISDKKKLDCSGR